MTDKSQEMLNESISSLVDGESSELELARILKALPDAALINEKWQRYHLTGEILRGDVKSAAANVSVPASFTSSVLAAIDAEDTIVSSAEKTSATQSWTHKLGKVAIAASVSLAVLIGFQYVGNNASTGSSPVFVNNEVQSSAPETLPGARVPEGFKLPSITARTVSNIDDNYGLGGFQSSLSSGKLPSHLSPATSFAPGSEEEKELRAQLKRMMLKHAGASSATGSMGALPYVRISGSTLDESASNSATVER